VVGVLSASSASLWIYFSCSSSDADSWSPAPRSSTIFHAENAINTAVRKIRSALKDKPGKPQFIATVPTKGYRFIGAVELADRSDSSVIESPAAFDGSVTETRTD
jgi:hypothetical protein